MNVYELEELEEQENLRGKCLCHICSATCTHKTCLCSKCEKECDRQSELVECPEGKIR